ncbi:hypothetical protein [Paenibacillus sp. UMB4589-SE434]|uniref:hypothetical protein n=1 Tax=Paenibacillus sp. UMB4589-SE434 TaxID=3046314 RepID=UPI00254A66C3|nr:hypothetical protein [Paenibacillus sp. UMB4589-SE434]MDK8179445.1 hypothetical protein [Paenibacillus sp. UMB4589-SE434]
MERNPTKIQFLFSMSFLFTLILCIAAFFYGVKYGTDQTEDKYSKQLQQIYAESHPGSYQQQDLVSYYHNVFRPYREFEIRWFDTLAKLSQNNHKAVESLSKLQHMAQEQYKLIKLVALSKGASELTLSQANYAASLSRFNDGLNHIIRNARQQDSKLDASHIQQQTQIKEAMKFALKGQQQYYSSILVWSRAQDDTIKQPSLKSKASTEQWKTSSFSAKNKYIADYLLHQGVIKPFLPQDLTARVDEITRQAGRSSTAVNSQSVDHIIKQLLSTNGVHAQDYKRVKGALYKVDSIPMLPMFVE